jgi:Domain of unknown function (DUF5667)
VRMGRPNQTHDRLDALLDGRPGEVTDDLAPLLAAAEALRADLADLELDPEVVDRHLEQALDRPATVVPLPVRNVGAGGSVLRRRLAAAGLAAALVLVPATAASAASAEALPGQALYPVKLAVEQFRLAAVQWSPTREAQERAKIAAKRLAELDRLINLEMYRQILPAINALNKAVQAANMAVVEAAEDGSASELVAAVRELEAVKDAQLGELNELTTIVSELPPANQVELTAAVSESRAIAAAPPVITTAPATTVGPTPTQPSATAGPPASDPSAPPSTAGPPTQPEPDPQPQPPPSSATTTEQTTSTTQPEPTTSGAPPETAGSPAGAGSEAPPTSALGP